MPDPERKTQNPQQRLEKGKRLPVGYRMPVNYVDLVWGWNPKSLKIYAKFIPHDVRLYAGGWP